jgi:hypothetical protein
MDTLLTNCASGKSYFNGQCVDDPRRLEHFAITVINFF